MKELQENDLVRIGDRLLETTAYGDAAGLPFETMTAEEIKAKYGEIDHLIAADCHPYFADEHKPGVWSDDTQLSIAVAQGLIAADGFDMEAQAEAHICSYEETPKVRDKHGELIPRGWGGSTYESVERLIQGVSPFLSGSPEGAGNGVLMKLSPLVLWQLAREVPAEERHRQYDTLTNMTHNNPVVRLTSRVHGDFLHSLATDPRDSAAVFDDALAEGVISSANQHEESLGLKGKLSDSLEFLNRAELRGKSDEILQCTDGKGFCAPQTLAMAYGNFLLNLSDFETTVYRAVRMGGDTDSVASITANLVNFTKKGYIVIPEDSNQLRDRDNLQKISHWLTEVALEKA